MKILITGNMGYVGPRVVRRLRATFPDANLVGLDTGWFAPQLTNAVALPESLLDAQYFCDVRDVSDDLLAGVDAVVHLAGVSNDPIGHRFGAVTHEINLLATVALAQRARKAGVRSFVFASSCSIYGHADDSPRTEQSEVNPLTAYAKSKVLAEGGIVGLAASGFRVTCLRFATACGMSERLRLDLVLNDFVAGAVASHRIRILSDGTPLRPLIDVDDMALAVEWAIGRGGDDALIANVGRNDANYSVRELAEAVAAAIPDTIVSINPEAQPDARSYRVDFSLFKKLAPDHTPRITLAESIEGLRSGLAAMPGLPEHVQDSPLIRLHTLSGLQRAGLLSDELRWTARRVGTPT